MESIYHAAILPKGGNGMSAQSVATYIFPIKTRSRKRQRRKNGMRERRRRRRGRGRRRRRRGRRTMSSPAGERHSST